MSKAFTKEDGPDEPVLIRHRPPLPEGTPNYITPRGLQTLRAELAAAKPGVRRLELERHIGAAVVAPPPTARDEVRFGARVTLRDEDDGMRQIQIVGVDEANPAAGLIAFVAPRARIDLLDQDEHGESVIAKAMIDVAEKWWRAGAGVARPGRQRRRGTALLSLAWLELRRVTRARPA